MPHAVKLVSVFTSGLLSAVRLLIPLELGGILLWALAEIAWSLLRDNQFQWLAVLPGIAFAAGLVFGPGWALYLAGERLYRIRLNKKDPQALANKPQLPLLPSEPLNTLPLLLLDLFLILSAVWLSDRFPEKSFRTPLLSFCQTTIHKLS